ncbi:coenzyme PQQ biosynthesis protein C [Beggiatoa alba B18LD]|uniref:Pyrroloquinoline-quinone synthase n=1 Tax=Beggiatoa alba B18LD TaxID=395493 RepID=I3CC96_9GAMM|nr:pyrroloquinoline-quinone synthase PqqC [Beggiatoa alba]EIJ41239.1 coenzyme PQQ biosynthesis protein C [Beggiatoa alba B18LD]
MTQLENRLPWSREEFTEKLRAKGAYYHIHHPFHIAMNSGKCTKEQVQGWVANRYYYQISIPIKDANVMANCPDREVRRGWVQRILDHDGQGDSEGGIEAWIRLGEACGMTREDITSLKYVLPGVRFAVDAYVNFARKAPWQEAVCSSLTELFAPEIHQKRLDNWPQYYEWIDKEGYFYFRKRLTEARRDVEQGLQVTLDYFTTREQQERALNILQFKLDVLWTMLDAMHLAYVADMPPYFNIPQQP